jgi:hypothetical protein
MNGKQIGALLAVGAAAFSGGVALGHFLAQKKVQEKIDAELNRIWHEDLEKKRKQLTVEDVIKEVNPAIFKPVAATEEEIAMIADAEPRTITKGVIDSLNIHPASSLVGGEIKSVKRIFDDVIPGWNWNEELNAREGQSIYIVTHSEFHGDELEGYTSGTLTYYQGDDMLTDELGVPVVPYRKFVGSCLNFGHGSGDPEIVYIRNETEKMEWEVILDTGRYEEEVLGLTVEDDYARQDEHLEHGVRRFRADD